MMPNPGKTLKLTYPRSPLNGLLRGFPIVGICLILLSLTQCSSFNVFPLAEDQRLGSQLDKEIRSNSREYPVLNKQSVRSFVQDITTKIVKSPHVRYRNTFAYKVEIINDDKTINAFCTPGGYIYVYTGLLKLLDNEASLAGVIGHEIAHAEKRHGTSRMTKALGATVLLDIVLGTNPDRAAQLAGNLFTGLALLKNSRDDEMESDELSFNYLLDSEWYPGGIKYFFEKVGTSSGSSIERLLSTHPLPKDRIDATNQRLQKYKIPAPGEANLHSGRYQSFKKTI